MNIELLTFLFFVSLFVFLMLGLPLSFVLGGVSIAFIYASWGPQGFYIVAAQTWGAMNKFTLVAIPLFVLMAMILERAGVANDLYDMMYLWFGPIREDWPSVQLLYVPFFLPCVESVWQQS